MKRLTLKRPLKKRISSFFLLGLISSFGLVVQAQEGGGGGTISFLPSNMNVGAKVGTSISYFSNEQPHSSMKQGIIAGISGTYNLDENMAASVEFYYFQAGGRMVDFFRPADYGGETAFYYETRTTNKAITIHNLEVPVLFKYSIPAGSAKAYAVAGPAFGFNISADTRNETTTFTGDGGGLGMYHTFYEQENISNEVAGVHYGLTAGIGTEIPILENYFLLIDLRYRYGLNEVMQGSSYTTRPQAVENIKNHSFYVTVGFGL